MRSGSHPHERHRRNRPKLIQAAVDAAIDDGPPPPELQLAWMCGEYHLPEHGGIYDQDAKTFYSMRSAENIYRVLGKMRNLKGADIHRLTDGERKLIKRLRDGGYW